jgi:beta-galactosidase
MEKPIEPAIIPVDVSPEGVISIKLSSPRPVWRITDVEPKGNWQSLSYNDIKWESNEGAFGNPEVMNHGTYTHVGTKCNANKLWLRKTFILNEIPDSPVLFVRHTGAITVWINDKVIYDSKDNLIEYIQSLIDNKSLQNGNNIIAVAFENQDEYSYIDLGILALIK